MRSLDPLALIPFARVKIDYDNAAIASPAQVEPLNLKQEYYRITFNQSIARSMFEQSVLGKHIEFEEFLLGLKFHEVFHIEFRSFDALPSLHSSFFHFIHNVLLDAQIEYNGAKRHPESSKYIQWCLTALKKDIEIQQSALYSEEERNVFIALKNTLFCLVRFGVVPQDADMDFVHFLLPIILSSMRNGSDNVVVAAEAVFEYIYACVSPSIQEEMEKSAKEESTILEVYGPLTENDVERIEESEHILPSNLREIIHEAKQLQSHEKLAGSGSHNLEVEEDHEFYRITINKYKQQIMTLRKGILELANVPIEVASYDGDMNFSRQHQAYIDSLTYEDSENFLIQQLREIHIDHVLLRDISGSTNAIKQIYAELTVCLHAAIQGIHGIRNAHIDFEGDAITLLKFDESIRTSRISPRSEGGTDLKPAYMQALQLKWKQQKKIMQIVTDGHISQGYQALENELIAKGIKIYKYNIDPDGDQSLIQTTIETFHKDIIAVLRKAVV